MNGITNGWHLRVKALTHSPRRLMCPLPPSAKPSFEKIRNAPAICSSCQRLWASLEFGHGIRNDACAADCLLSVFLSCTTSIRVDAVSVVVAMTPNLL